MKLAKKLLACVVALALIGSFALMAFAEGEEKVIVQITTADKVVKDQNVKVTVSLKNAVGVGSANIFFTYDKDALEFVSAKDIAPKGDVVAEKISGEFECSVGLMLSGGITESDFVLAEFVFKVKADTGAKTKLEFTNATKVYGTDNNAKAADLKNLELTVEAAAPATTAPSTTVPGTTVPKTGDVGGASLAAAAGLVVLAGAAFVVSKKKK